MNVHISKTLIFDVVLIRSNPILYEMRVLKIIRSLSKKYSLLVLGWDREGTHSSFEILEKIFASCSIREGFGLTFLEANACGLPVVCVRSKENAASKIIRNGVNGLLVELEPAQVSKGIVSLLENDELRNKWVL